MARRQVPPQQSHEMIMGGGESGGFSYVGGEHLKQVDVPVETLLGFANGAISGATLGAGASAMVTFAQHEGRGGLGKEIIKNLTKDKKHIGSVLGVTVALGALGGLVRHSRAAHHNEWSEQYYDLLEQQSRDKQSFAERERERESKKDAEKDEAVQR